MMMLTEGLVKAGTVHLVRKSLGHWTLSLVSCNLE